VFAAAPKTAGQRKIWTLDDISDQPILTFANNTKPSRQIREMLAPHCSKSLDMTTSTSLGALIRLASSGFGICAIPKAVVKSELFSGELVELKTAFELPTISFTASFVSGGASSDLMTSISAEVSEFLKTRTIKNIYQT